MREQSTLVVVSDRATARFFARPAHRGDLVELAEFEMRVSPAPCERDYPDDISGFFLADVASQISDTMRKTSSSNLILCAEDQALASLRSFLGSACLARTSTLAGNVVAGTLDDVSRRLSMCGALH